MTQLETPWLWRIQLLILLFASATSRCSGASSDLWMNEHELQDLSKLPFWHYLRQDLRTLGQQYRPQNITGAFQGQLWNHVTSPRTRRSNQVLKANGSLLYQLSTTKGDFGKVDYVEGQVVMWTGMYRTEDEMRMRVDGAFVPELGRLRAVLEPEPPVLVPLTEADRKPCNRDCRHALREAARQWMMYYNATRGLGRRAHLFPEPDIPQRYKKCIFYMEAYVYNTSAVDAISADATAKVSFKAEPVDSNVPPDFESTTDSKPLAPTLLLPLAVRRAPALRGQRDHEWDTGMAGVIYSKNCNVTWTFNTTYLNLQLYYRKAVHYTLVTTAITFGQILLLIRQMDSSSSASMAGRVSLVMVGSQAVMDAYLCLVHLTAALYFQQLFNAFATAAFFEFIMFAIFGMRYMLLVWRAQQPNMADDSAVRRELSLLYMRFYGVLLAGSVLTYQLRMMLPVLVLLLFSFWVPQIVHSVISDTRQPLRPSYILGIAASRLVLPLYLYGCPDNLAKVPPQPMLCMLLVLWSAAQVTVLLLQHQWGPRCIIPRRFQRGKYDYFRAASAKELGACTDQHNADVETGHGGAECVICMNPVDMVRTSARMVTPCGHFFHSQCLQRWMDVKMECPTCRRTLPPL